MCRLTGDGQTPIVELRLALTKDLIDATATGSGSLGVPHLREAANNCPACILSVLREAKVFADFNWADEVKSFWNDVNAARESCV